MLRCVLLSSPPLVFGNLSLLVQLTCWLQRPCLTMHLTLLVIHVWMLISGQIYEVATDVLQIGWQTAHAVLLIQCAKWNVTHSSTIACMALWSWTTSYNRLWCHVAQEKSHHFQEMSLNAITNMTTWLFKQSKYYFTGDFGWQES